MQARSGEAPVGGVKISDHWLQGTASMASGLSYSSFVPAQRVDKYVYFSVSYINRPNRLQGLIRMQNWRFAHFLNGDSLISCASHKN
jgi:hypothetical protein